MYYTYENMSGSIDGCMQNIKTTLSAETMSAGTRDGPCRSLVMAPPPPPSQTDSDKQLSLRPLVVPRSNELWAKTLIVDNAL